MKAARTHKTVQFALGAYPDEDAEYERAATPAESFYSHMLVEDISNGIMPIGGRRTSGEFNISLSGGDYELTEVIRLATSTEYPGSNLAESVSDLFQECSQTVAVFGEAYYEIAYTAETEETVAGFQLVHIRPLTIGQEGTSFYQVIPAELAAKLRKPARIALLPTELLRFDLPLSYRKALKNTLQSLHSIANSRFGDLESPEGNKVEMTKGFDGKHYRDTEILALAEATSEIGWGVRSLIYDNAYDYYVLHRYLKFELFLAVFREHLLRQLNSGLEPVRRRLKKTGDLVMEGLASSGDIQRALKELAEGSIQFERVMQDFSTL